MRRRVQEHTGKGFVQHRGPGKQNNPPATHSRELPEEPLCSRQGCVSPQACTWESHVRPPRVRTSRSPDLHPASDYKCFNSSNVSIRPWSWNYRSCWHQTCPPVDTHHCVWIASIPSSASRERLAELLQFVAASPEVSQHWAICVPAAHLGSGSRLSGSLSGIEP